MSNPLLDILPYEGYQNNQTVQWIAEGAGTDLEAITSKATTFYQTLIPDTATSETLNYLAPLVGLTGSYWSPAWSLSVKRNMVKNAHQLWRTIGTEAAINLALSSMEVVGAKLWTRRRLTIPFKVPGRFQSQSLKFYLTLPFPNSRTSYTWLEAERVLRNFKPAITDGSVCYSKFILGYSRVGDPIL
jgi:Phage tail protein (Tail_P2_I)